MRFGWSFDVVDMVDLFWRTFVCATSDRSEFVLVMHSKPNSGGTRQIVSHSPFGGSFGVNAVGNVAVECIGIIAVGV